MLIRKHNTAHVFNRKNRETVGERIFLSSLDDACDVMINQLVYLNDRVSSAYHWKRPLSMTHFYYFLSSNDAGTKVYNMALNLSLSHLFY